MEQQGRIYGFERRDKSSISGGEQRLPLPKTIVLSFLRLEVEDGVESGWFLECLDNGGRQRAM